MGRIYPKLRELKIYLRYAAKTVEDAHDLEAIIRDLQRRLERWDKEG